MGADVSAEGEDAVEVDLEDFVEVGVGEEVGGVPALDAGAVDEDADFPGGAGGGISGVVEDGGDEGGDGGWVGQVGGVDGGFAAEGVDGGLGCR